MARTTSKKAPARSKGGGKTHSAVQHIRQTFGNRTMGRLLGGGRSPNLAPMLGRLRGVMDRPGDRAERRAEGLARSGGERAGEAQSSVGPKMRGTRRPDFGVLEGTAFARTLARGLSGGRSVSADIREPMERKLDTDLRDVRLHDGPAGGRIARSLGARAATVGHNIYVDRRQVDPGSHSGREVMRHELTHVGQNKGSPSAGRAGAAIQRAYTKRRQDNWDTVYDCYSDIVGNTEPLSNPFRFGAAYVGASAEVEFGGHAWVAFEYFDRMDDPSFGEWIYPNTIWTDLVTDTVRIEKEDAARGRLLHMMQDDKYVGQSFFPLSPRRIQAAIAQASAIAARYKGDVKPHRKDRKDALYYTKTGVGKKHINCAKYVEELLVTAGADASAGKLIKTPNQVATSMKHGDFKKAHGKPKGKKGFS